MLEFSLVNKYFDVQFDGNKYFDVENGKGAYFSSSKFQPQDCYF